MCLYPRYLGIDVLNKHEHLAVYHTSLGCLAKTRPTRNPRFRKRPPPTPMHAVFEPVTATSISKPGVWQSDSSMSRSWPFASVSSSRVSGSLWLVTCILIPRTRSCAAKRRRWPQMRVYCQEIDMFMHVMLAWSCMRLRMDVRVPTRRPLGCPWPSARCTGSRTVNKASSLI